MTFARPARVMDHAGRGLPGTGQEALVKPLRTRVATTITVLMALCLATHAHAATDPVQLRFGMGVQADRLHSVPADSLGLSSTQGITTRMACDLRVLALPMKGADRPELHVTGETNLAQRAMPIGEFAGPGYTGPPVEEQRVIEVLAGAHLTLPMSMVAADAGTAFRIGYRGGLLLAHGGRNDFPHLKQVFFGFERTRGFFENTSLEMAYGTNEAAGREYGSGRWAATLHLEGAIGAPRAPRTGKGAAPGAGAPVHLFLDVQVDTDGAEGPDLLTGRAGVVVDAGRALQGLFGGE